MIRARGAGPVRGRRLPRCPRGAGDAGGARGDRGRPGDRDRPVESGRSRSARSSPRRGIREALERQRGAGRRRQPDRRAARCVKGRPRRSCSGRATRSRATGSRRTTKGVIDGLVADDAGERVPVLETDVLMDTARRQAPPRRGDARVRARAHVSRRCGRRRTDSVRRRCGRSRSSRSRASPRPSSACAAELSAGADRRALVEAMFSDVLVALRRAHSIEQILVVAAIARAADRRRLRRAASSTIDERGPQPRGDARDRARRSRTGSTRALLVPGDCPMLDPGQLDAAARRPARPPLGADRARTATAPAPTRCCSPRPDALAPSFGPDSCRASRRPTRRRAGTNRRGRRGPARWRSTSIRSTTSRRCTPRSPTRTEARRTRAACSTS